MRKKASKTVKKKRKIANKRHGSNLLTNGARILPYLFFIFLLFFLFKTGEFILLNSDYFSVKNIEVIGEDSTQKKSDILKKFNKAKGNNIFSQDLKEIENTLSKSYPEIKKVIVQRLLPDTIMISYEKRRPLFQVESGFYYIVSEEGVILPDPGVREYPGLVVVSGLKVPTKGMSQTPTFKRALRRALGIVRDIQESNAGYYQDRIKKINIFDIENPALFLDDNTRVEIGEYRLKDKAVILKKILDELESKNKKARVVDLRFEDIIVVPR
jgi:cell division septal protein FtsQ